MAQSVIMMVLYLYLLLSFIEGVPDCDKRDKGERVFVSNFKDKDSYNRLKMQCGAPNMEVVVYRYCTLPGVHIDMDYMRARYPHLSILYWKCQGGCSYNPREDIIFSGKCKGKQNLCSLYSDSVSEHVYEDFLLTTRMLFERTPPVC